MRSNLIIGSSHALQLADAIGAHSGDINSAQDALIPIASPRGGDTRLIYAMPLPAFMVVRMSTDGKIIHPEFREPIDEIRAFNAEGSRVIFMLGGNEPAFKFFYRNPRPFDFFYPGTPAPEPGRQLLPLAAMKELVADLLMKSSLATQILAKELPKAKRYHVSSPPPIPSEEHIRKHPEIFDFKTFGIEDPLVRLKIYLIQMQQMRDLCAAHDITFVDSAVGKTDEAGFLQERYWSGSTHASVDYYRDIVDALEL